jgi:hypothetical protein
VAQRAPLRPTARIEEAIGFVGMFGVLFLAATVFCEVTGRPALGWALTLLVCVLAVVVLDRWRVAVLRRTRSTDGIGGAPAVPAAAGPVRRTAARTDSGSPVVGAGRGPVPGTTAEARVHRHVGWDELAPAGRRPARAGHSGRARTTTASPTALAGAAATARPATVRPTTDAGPTTTVEPTAEPTLGGPTLSAAPAAARARARHVGGVTRPADR